MATRGSRMFGLALAVTVAACAQNTIDSTPVKNGYRYVGPGSQFVGRRLAVVTGIAWNESPLIDENHGAPSWTVDGPSLDDLRFYVGIPDGAVMVQANDQHSAPVVFHANMKPEDTVVFFQERLGKQFHGKFQLDSVEPCRFLQGDGIRFKYSIRRETDDLMFSGVGFSAIRNGQLTGIVFTATRLGFYPRLVDEVQKIADSAVLKS